jgi:hypothetical protein
MIVLPFIRKRHASRRAEEDTSREQESSTERPR